MPISQTTTSVSSSIRVRSPYRFGCCTLGRRMCAVSRVRRDALAELVVGALHFRVVAVDVLPGETEEQFQHTLDLLAELRFDVVHVAMFSPRPGTPAGDQMADLLTPEEKKERLYRVERLQEQDVAR